MSNETQVQAHTEPACTRWNFDATEDHILVCKNLHDKGDKCEYQRLHPADALAIINELRSAVLEASARQLQQAALPSAEPLGEREAFDLLADAYMHSFGMKNSPVRERVWAAMLDARATHPT